MCGICGGVALDGADALSREALQAMAGTLMHRGPDSSGFALDGPAGLAIRRLAIIDVSGGDQPLYNEDGRISIVCNGEIYNYRELRQELIQAGHRLRTGSDVEVVVHAYEQWGDDFVNRLNGMFAFALWDGIRRRLLLARDRPGIKPLYYAQHDGKLLFGSELKALLAYPDFPRELDLISLAQYLTYEYVPTPRCILKGVRKLRPGHMLIIEDGGFQERPYWRLDLEPRPVMSSERDLAEQVWQTLRESVRKELVSDVPLGVFLSGGIDSSAVTAAMADLGSDVHSFGIGFEDRSFDESAYARQVAAYLGTNHSEMTLEPRMLWELVPTMADKLDEPFADASVIPTFLLSRFARQQVTVALGGDGGDELFAGYSTLQAHRLAGWYRRLPRLLTRDLIPAAVQRLPVSHNNLSLDFRAKRFVSAMAHAPAERHQLWLGSFAPAETDQLLTPEAAAELDGYDAFDALDEHLASSRSCDDLSQVLYLDMKMYMEGDILTKVDRASMACSLEVRVPLLNLDLLELATHLPVDFKLHGFTRKYILRRALAGRLPREIIQRPKKGFGIPVARWFRGDLKELLLDSLNEDRLRRQGLFQPAYVSGLIDDHLTGRRDNRKPLWTLLMFQLWSDRWM